MKMNQEIQKKWTDRLESNKYEQCTGALNFDGGFCCLGVLCEIAVDEGIVERIEAKHGLQSIGVEQINIGYRDPANLMDFNAATLPQAVVKWAELSSENPMVNVHDKSQSLPFYNDHAKRTFYEIAQMIKASD